MSDKPKDFSKEMLDCFLPNPRSFDIPLFGNTPNNITISKPIPPTKKEALLPFGINPELLGELQNDGSRLILYTLQTESTDNKSRNLGDYQLTPPNKTMTEAMQQAFFEAEKVANVRFETTTDPKKAHLIIAGVTYREKEWGGHEEKMHNQKIIALNNKDFFYLPRSDNIATSLHELGHALGLNHPRRYVNEENSSYRCELPPSLDSRSQSVMSYTFDQKPVTYAPMDIAALQALYGKPQNAAKTIILDASRLRPEGGLVTVSDKVVSDATLHVPRDISTAHIDLSKPLSSLYDPKGRFLNLQIDGLPFTAVMSDANTSKLTSRLMGGTLLSGTGNETFYIIHGKNNAILDGSIASNVTLSPNAQVSVETKNPMLLSFPSEPMFSRTAITSDVIKDTQRTVTFRGATGETYEISVPKDVAVAPIGGNLGFMLAPATSAKKPPSVSGNLPTPAEIGLRK